MDPPMNSADDLMDLSATDYDDSTYDNIEVAGLSAIAEETTLELLQLAEEEGVQAQTEASLQKRLIVALKELTSLKEEYKRLQELYQEVSESNVVAELEELRKKNNILKKALDKADAVIADEVQNLKAELRRIKEENEGLKAEGVNAEGVNAEDVNAAAPNGDVQREIEKLKLDLELKTVECRLLTSDLEELREHKEYNDQQFSKVFNDVEREKNEMMKEAKAAIAEAHAALKEARLLADDLQRQLLEAQRKIGMLEDENKTASTDIVQKLAEAEEEKKAIVANFTQQLAQAQKEKEALVADFAQQLAYAEENKKAEVAHFAQQLAQVREEKEAADAHFAQQLAQSEEEKEMEAAGFAQKLIQSEEDTKAEVAYFTQQLVRADEEKKAAIADLSQKLAQADEEKNAVCAELAQLRQEYNAEIQFKAEELRAVVADRDALKNENNELKKDLEVSEKARKEACEDAFNMLQRINVIKEVINADGPIRAAISIQPPRLRYNPRFAEYEKQNFHGNL